MRNAQNIQIAKTDLKNKLNPSETMKQSEIGSEEPKFLSNKKEEKKEASSELMNRIESQFSNNTDNNERESNISKQSSQSESQSEVPSVASQEYSITSEISEPTGIQKQAVLEIKVKF